MFPNNDPRIGLGQSQTPDASRDHRDASVGGNESGVASVTIPMPFLGIGPDPRNGPKRPTQGRWLTGLYLDMPTEMDDLYRFFRRQAGTSDH